MLCGTGRAVINPDIGHSLAGYGVVPNTGVHDNVAVTAMYLSDGDVEALLLVFDLIALGHPLNQTIREAVGHATSVAPEAVFLAATHTHSGPEVREYYYGYGPVLSVRPEYNAALPELVVRTAVEAKATAEDCTLLYNFTTASENMNRRYSFPDRRHLYIPSHKQLAGLSDQHVDRELGIVAFRKRGTANRYKAVVTNYAAHPLCVGVASSLVSADYQGVLRATVEETFDGCRCLSTTGAAGNLHPLLPEGGFRAAQLMGTALGNAAIARCYDAVPVEYDTKLRLGRRRVELRVKDEATQNGLPGRADRARDLAQLKAVGLIDTSVALLGIGPILLAGVPGELVAELGSMIKWASPFLKTYVLFQATDDIGYITTRNQYLWGGMEAASTSLAAGEGERVVASVIDAAEALVAADPLTLPPLD